MDRESPRPQDAGSTNQQSTKSVQAALSLVTQVPRELASLPQYTQVEPLGEGGMGVVYKAHHSLMNRSMVLKVVNRQLLARAGAKERFLREIRAAASLHHVNIVAAHDAFYAGDSLVFAMEYVAGQDLQSLVKSKGPLKVHIATYFAYQVALGLQHAHEAGMIHRDIKPHNLMVVPQGRKRIVKILDFGLAKATKETANDSDLTGTGAAIGTPDYMPPEQTEDAARADIRADIYALGCTLFYLLMGKPPFQANNLFQLMYQHRESPPPRLDELRPDVPPNLADIVAKMLAKKPGDRFQTPQEVARALTPFFRAPANKSGDRPMGLDTANESEEVEILNVASMPVASALPLATLIPRNTTPATPTPIPLIEKNSPPLLRTAVSTKRSLPWGYLSLFLVAMMLVSGVAFWAGRTTPRSNAANGNTTVNGTPVTDPNNLKPGAECQFPLNDSLKMTFCWIPAGKAILGSPQSEIGRRDDEETFEFTCKGFWMGKYEVTQEEWAALDIPRVEANYFSTRGAGSEAVRSMNTDRFPVENVNWHECDRFIKTLNTRNGIDKFFGKKGKFALPREVEWEYACRGGLGNVQPFYFGFSANGEQANCDGNFPYGLENKGPYIGRTAPVGSYQDKAPHPWGLCDMHGNVWEWCEDLSKTDTELRAIRGGSWYFLPEYCRSGIRMKLRPEIRGDSNGFRICYRID